MPRPPQRSRRFAEPRWAYEMERRLLAAIHAAQRGEESDMSQLDSRIQTLTDNVNSVGDAIQTEVQQLRDAIAAGQPVTADQLSRLDQLSQQLTGDVTSLQADDTPPAPAA